MDVVARGNKRKGGAEDKRIKLNALYALFASLMIIYQ